MSMNLRIARVTIVTASLLIAGLFSIQADPISRAATSANNTSNDTLPMSRSTVLYKTAKIDGLDIFYREAGPRNAPTILLLHGFPTSSHMFRNLIPKLADKYHVIAPDYPG